MGAKDSHAFVESCDALLGVGVAFFREKGPENGTGNPLMHNRQDQKVDRNTPEHPHGAIERSGGGGRREKGNDDVRNDRRWERHVVKKPLEASVVRLDLGSTGKRRGELGQIDRFDLEQRHDERSQTFHPGKMPAGTVEFEDLGEHGKMIHGVISWPCGRCGTVVVDSHYRGLHLFFNKLFSFVVYSGL